MHNLGVICQERIEVKLVLSGTSVYLLHFRPPDIRVGGLMFYHGFFLSSFFLFSPPNLRSRWTELNQNRPHARK